MNRSLGRCRLSGAKELLTKPYLGLPAHAGIVL